MIPDHTKAALDRYVEHKILPGGFLMAVLSNDLFGAVGRADSQNLAALPDIVKYVYNEMPGDSWGSEGQIYKWVEDRFYKMVGGE
jgi:hypothetical protein